MIFTEHWDVLSDGEGGFMKQEELKSLVSYREDGNLIWKEREPVDRIAKTFNSRFSGKVVAGEYR